MSFNDNPYPFAAHSDGNQQWSAGGVVGTLGTADIGGTASVLPISVNPNTGAQYVEILGGTSGNSGTNVNVVTGTINSLPQISIGTIPQVSVGTLPQVSIGTIPQISVGTLPNVNIATGTINQFPNSIISILGTAGDPGTLPVIANENWVWGNTGARWARAREIENGVNSTGQGIQELGLIAQFDDVAISAVTENQFAPVRLTSTRELLIAGTLTGVTTVSNLTNGSVNILTGTIQSSGTTTGVGVVSNLTNGSINVLTGTLQALTTVTTVSNLTNGSVNILTGTVTRVGQLGTIESGTITTLTQFPTAGSIADLAANPSVTKIQTFPMVWDGAWNRLGGDNADNDANSATSYGLVADNRNRLYNGSTWDLQRGNLGTAYVQVNPVPIPTMVQFGTLGTAGGSFFGTISAPSGAGTKHFISGVSVVQQSGTADVRVLAGSAIQGTGVLSAGNRIAGGIDNKTFDPAFATGTNSEIIYHFVGAGSAFITVSYWKGA